LCENCQRQSCKAFIGLTNRAKIIGGGDPLYQKFWIKVTTFESCITYVQTDRQTYSHRNYCHTALQVVTMT